MDLSLQRWISWISHGGPSQLKHQGLHHPLIACLLYYFIVTIVSVYTHDALISSSSCSSPPRPGQPVWAFVLLLYSITLLLWRHTYTPIPILLYEQCWLCNVTLLQVAGALFTHRPALAHAYCVTVGIDQLLWYVDLSSCVVTRGQTFLIGVAKYLVWPTNATWARRCTSTHHLWTIPVALHVLRQRMEPEAYALSAVAMLVNVVMSRWLIPASVLWEGESTLADGSTTKGHNYYLNVNLSWEVWKDIKFRWLQVRSDQPPFLYMLQLMWRWQGFNTIIFILLSSYCRQMFPETPACEPR